MKKQQPGEAGDRAPILDRVQTIVLTKSRRRCCLCFWLNGLDESVKGQLAHLDQDSANSSESNLVFLCLSHHDEYDTIPRQAKALRQKEVSHWRDELYREMHYRFRDQTAEKEKQQEEFMYLEEVAGDLLSALRADLKKHPLVRFVTHTRNLSLDFDNRRVHIYESTTIPEIIEKLEVLYHRKMLTHFSGQIFLMTEQFVDYLRATSSTLD